MTDKKARRPRSKKRRPRRGFKPFSEKVLAARRASVPKISYPAQLPVSARRGDIAEAIANNQVVILSGQTGSGKTTQLPKICLELGRGIAGMIGHTQPRRLAARTVAERISEELGRPLGETVGFQVRFTDKVSDKTLVKLMTDGILLAEIQSDPLLRRYDTIIVDEAHERSLNIDFILGYLARLLPSRPDLKVIITSATIDSERFARAFGTAEKPAPMLDVSGRTFPVEVRYRPLEIENLVEDGGDIHVEAEPIDQVTGIIEAVDELLEEPADSGPCDILVFLPGERDIRETQEALEDHLRHRPAGRAVQVLPLFSRLAASEQRKIFAPHSRQRIVLATNVAETSLTVPGIRYVVDPGLARISRYSNRTKVQRLPIEPISQASANQRSGRCGRLAPGVAIRLYSQEDFESRPAFTEPEILRTSLAAVILQMASLHLGKVEDFPFIDPPEAKAVRDGKQLLFEVGAFTKAGALTSIGRKLARLPIDPRLGRMLLEADERGCASEVLVIIAALSMQDIRERPADAQEASDAKHRRLADRQSDFITYLNLWRYVRTLSRELTNSAFRRSARKEYLHFLRIREWQDVVLQLRQMARDIHLRVHKLAMPPADELRQVTAGAAPGSSEFNDAVAAACVELTAGPTTTDADSIHQSILTGLLSNLGAWVAPHKVYEGARGTRFVLWPGSGLRGTHPDWVMAAELVETSRLFARTAAAIRPEWVEPAASHLSQRSFGDPTWSKSAGSAVVREKVTLYGMTLIADRKVRLATAARQTADKVKAQEMLDLARQMFIRKALVEGEWNSRHRFVRQNAQVLDRAYEVERRRREVGLVASDDALVAFFEDRLPPEVTDQVSFDNWWKGARRRQSDYLTYTMADVLPRVAANENEEEEGALDKRAFPDHWKLGDIALPLSYVFAPGDPADGVSLTVPLEVLPRLREKDFEWLVPGFLDQLCTGIVRSLPKAVRRELVPAPDVGALVAKWIRSGGKTSREAASTFEQKQAAALDQSMARLASWAGLDVKRNPKEPPQAKPEPKQAPRRQIKAGEGDLREAVRAGLRAVKAVDVSIEDIDHAIASLPEHLRMRFVVTQNGQQLATARELVYLQRTLDTKASAAVRSAVSGAVARAMAEAGIADPRKANKGKKLPGKAKRAKGDNRELSPLQATKFSEEEALTGWPSLEKIPDSVVTASKTMTVRAYPGLVDPHAPVRADLPPTPGTGAGKTAPKQVALRLLAEGPVREREHRLGVIRLLTQQLALPPRRVTTRWRGEEAAALAQSPYQSTEAMVADAQWAAVASLLDQICQLMPPPSQPALPGGLPRTKAAYEAVADWMQNQLEDRLYQIMGHVAKALAANANLNKAIRQANQLSLLDVLTQVKAQQQQLIYPGFIARTPAFALKHLGRYLAGAHRRVVRGTPDQRAAYQLHQVAAEVEDAVLASERLPWDQVRSQRLERAQWMVQELAVQVYAQTLGTAVKVSPKRIRELLD
ncbi:hypothetical protein HMPREF2851_04835 [Actinomyces sp. HMSC064C12]|nr:hypothetical protein HMPREF2851_04835 [Actinomyces sp. HMSC064C12]